MKNLRTLAAIWTLFGATHAHALEKNFLPVQESGEIEGIELLPSGKLMVKSTGNIFGVPTPYMVLGTNTDHFAESAFTTTGMTNLTSMVFDKNYIYATRENDTNHVYRFTVDDSKNLNGLKSTVKVYDTHDAHSILCVKDDVIYTQNQDKTNTFAINAEGETATPPSVDIPNLITDNYVYAVSNEGMVYYWEGAKLKMYNPETAIGSTLGTTDVFEENTGRTPISMVALNQNNIFTLANDGNLYRSNHRKTRFAGENLTGISYGHDGTSIIMSVTQGTDQPSLVFYYDPIHGMMIRIDLESEINNQKFTQKEVSANGLKYHVTNKKIGHSIAD